jgi:type VI secretion system protein ImpK
VSLIDQFHNFYEKVLSVEKQIATAEITPLAARETLERHLERQQLAVERESGSFGVDMFLKAKYAMAALADELLLAEGSAARETWINHLLETAVFKSQQAGEKLFRDIEELQGDRRAEAEGLARVYLAVLGLGFEGKYRDSPDAENELEQYRRRLYRLIFAREPALEDLDETKIVPGAYAATLDDGQVAELPYLRPWLLALALLFLLWLAVGHAIWQSSTAEIAPLIDNILSITIAPGAAR